MNAMQKRFSLFLGACIPIRLFLVYLAYHLPVKYLPYMGLAALPLAGGFIYLFLTGKRTSGVETQGAPIWWRQFRIVHGLLYLLFAFYAIQRVATAYQILLADVCFGLVIFLWHHYTTGSFTQLFK